MKNVLLFFCCTVLLTTLSFGQLNYQFSSFGISGGVDEDRVIGMGASYFVESTGAELPREVARTINDGEAYSMICENPHLGLDFSLRNESKEIRLSTYFIFNRIDAVSYQSPAGYADINSYGNEVGLDVAHLWRSNLARHWHLYGGGGVQGGYGFGTRVSAWGSDESTIASLSFRQNGGTITNQSTVRNTYGDSGSYAEYKAPNTVHGRAYVLGGASFDICDRLEFTMEGRWGYGFRQNKFSGSATNLRSIRFGLRWNLKTPEQLGTWIPIGS